MDNSSLYYRINKLYDNFAASANANGRFFFMLDISLDTARWSPAAVNTFALPGEYIAHHSQVLKDVLAPEDADAFLADVQAAAKGRLERKETQWHMKDREGKFLPCAVKYFTVKDYTGLPAYIGVAITSLEIDSHTDPTTNLPGQVRFLEHLRTLFSTRRHAVIMLIGTINFSEVNNLYGYTFGNSVIAALAQHLQDLSHGSGELFRGEGTMLLFCSETMTAEEEQALMRRLSPLPRQQVYFSSVVYPSLRHLAGKRVLLVTGIANPLPLQKKIEEAEEATMPNSCRSIIKKCRHKEAISEQEEEKLLRNLRSKELIGAEWFRSLLSSFGYNRTGRGS